MQLRLDFITLPLIEVPLDLFPDDANELNGVAHLLPQWNGISAHVLVLPKPERGDAAGILEPPVFRCCLSSGEVMVSLIPSS